MELDRLSASRVVAELYKRTAQRGVRLEVSRDFERLEGLLTDIEEKKQLTEHFRRNLNTYTPAQAFWLGGFNRVGRLVALAAARLDCLGSWSLEQYWREYWSRCYPASNSEPVAMADQQFRFARGVKGNVVYLGEMWVHSEHSETIGSGDSAVDTSVSGDFAKALQILSILEFDAELLYAWVRPSFLDRGFAYKCGFSSTHPGIRWERGPSTIDPDLRVMASTRESLFDLVDLLSFELPEE